MSGAITVRRFTEVAVKCANFETCQRSEHGQYETKTRGLNTFRKDGWEIVEHQVRSDGSSCGVTVECPGCIRARADAKAKRETSEALLKSEIAQKQAKLAELRKGK